jgi:hypothetical protein
MAGGMKTAAQRRKEAKRKAAEEREAEVAASKRIRTSAIASHESNSSGTFNLSHTS